MVFSCFVENVVETPISCELKQCLDKWHELYIKNPEKYASYLLKQSRGSAKSNFWILFLPLLVEMYESKHSKKFEEIVVTYPPADLCTYPEYRGKPYFSIKYEENGEHFVGFGTYKPEVLSRYLRKYFIKQTIIEVDKENDVNCTDLCKSCNTKGCIFQSGIVRSHCDFYKTKSDEEE